MNQYNQRNRIVELYCLLLADLLSIMISYALAVLIRFGSLQSLWKGELHLLVCLCLLFFSTIFSLLLDWNRGFIKRGYFIEFTTVLKYNGIMVASIGFLFFLIKQAEFLSRLTIGYFFLINLTLSYAAHLVVKKLLIEYLKSEYSKVQIMMIVEEENAEDSILHLQKTLPINYEISAIALLNANRVGEQITNIPVVADSRNLMEVARQLPLDEVFIRLEKEPNVKIREIIQDCEEMGVICHYSMDIMDWNAKERHIGKFGEYTVVTYSIYNIDYRRRTIKRGMDIAGSIVGLCITAIVTPFVALAIKLESKGPVFFSQTRIGKNGRRFSIYKFRSMYLDAEELKKELEEKNEIKGLMFKMEDDPRVTKVGKFLRKTSIDELPQFYNILKGDMSLVGTRPPTTDEFGKYSIHYRRRLSMTPGLTGLWQVSGRSNIEDFDEVVKYDLEYIDKWSLSLDIKILIQTIFVVFAGRGSK